MEYEAATAWVRRAGSGRVGVRDPVGETAWTRHRFQLSSYRLEFSQESCFHTPPPVLHRSSSDCPAHAATPRAAISRATPTVSMWLIGRACFGAGESFGPRICVSIDPGNCHRRVHRACAAHRPAGRARDRRQTRPRPRDARCPSDSRSRPSRTFADDWVLSAGLGIRGAAAPESYDSHGARLWGRRVGGFLDRLSHRA